MERLQLLCVNLNDQPSLKVNFNLCRCPACRQHSWDSNLRGWYLNNWALHHITFIRLHIQHTYTKQLRSARSSIKSNSWLISYVMEGLLGFILLRCSSYILHTPVKQDIRKENSSSVKTFTWHVGFLILISLHCK